MRAGREVESTRQALADATGVSDPAVLDQLAADGVTGASATALSLAPLVAVAWADRKLEDKERQAVIRVAEESGVAAGTPAHDLLEDWLRDEPPRTLMNTWSDYATALAADLPSADREALLNRLVERTTAVANAAGGGFAGLGSKVSDAEAAVINRVKAALGG
jgi:uncharacterized tellurite resistance protein B-like protein